MEDLSGVVQKIFPTKKRNDLSVLYVWDREKKKSFFPIIENRQIKSLKIKIRDNVSDILKRYYNYPSIDINEIKRLKSQKAISDNKLGNKNFILKAPKDVVEQEIKKNKDITNKLSLYTN